MLNHLVLPSLSDKLYKIQEAPALEPVETPLEQPVTPEVAPLEQPVIPEVTPSLEEPTTPNAALSEKGRTIKSKKTK